MRIFLTLLVSILFCINSFAITFNFDSPESVEQSAGGYTVTLSQGKGSTAPMLNTNNDPAQMRLYAYNQITVSGPDLRIIGLVFSKNNSKAYASISGTTGQLESGGLPGSSLDFKTDVWKGDAQTVTFTLGISGQRIISQIIINEEIKIDDDKEKEPDVPKYPEELDPEYVYSEPTVLTVPDMQVQGAAYSFVENNILVNVTRGAVHDSYFSAHAGYSITFTATKPMKGIAIDGFVKKGFEATVSSGEISYLTPDTDKEASPVIVITDIEDNSVTINCLKQLRCYSVEIYFEENPEDEVGSHPIEGEAVRLSFDTADAVYESEFSSWVEGENYSIYLYDAADPDGPYVGLDIYPAQKDELEGNYSTADYSLGEYTYYVYGKAEDDITWIAEGSVIIAKSENEFTITGKITCDNNKIYNLNFAGALPIYLDEDYYSYYDDSAVEKIENDREAFGSDNMFNISGQQVGKDFKGMYIKKGKKYIAR